MIIIVIAAYVSIGFTLAMLLPFLNGYGAFNFMKQKFQDSYSRTEFNDYISCFIMWVVLWPIMILPLLGMMSVYGSGSLARYINDLGESMRKD